MHRFDQKAPENVAELEELRSWDHELHFTKIALVHWRKTCLLQVTHDITLFTVDNC
jgi:hypothetical protein